MTIALIALTGIESVTPLLDEDQGTVGTIVNVTWRLLFFAATQASSLRVR